MSACAAAAPPTNPPLQTTDALFSSGTNATAVGTAHPLHLLDADPDGRWVAMCQARHDTNGDGDTTVSFGDHGERYGDAWRPYMVWGGGEGIAIDGFLGSDRTGRFAAFVLEGRLMLLDAEQRTIATVHPTFEVPGAQSVNVRGVTFDARGKRLAFVADGEAWLYRPASNTTQRVDTGSIPARQIFLSSSGTSVVTFASKGPAFDRCGRGSARRSAAHRLVQGRGGRVVEIATDARRRLPRRTSVMWTGDALLLDPPRRVPVILDDQRRLLRPFGECDEPWLVSAEQDEAKVVVRCKTAVQWTPSGTAVVPDYVAPPQKNWIGAPTLTYSMTDRDLPPPYEPYTTWRLSALDGHFAVVAEPTSGTADTNPEAVWIDLESGIHRSLGRVIDAHSARLRDHHVAFDRSIFDIATGDRVLDLQDAQIEFLGNRARALVRADGEINNGSARIRRGPLHWIEAQR